MSLTLNHRTAEPFIVSENEKTTSQTIVNVSSSNSLSFWAKTLAALNVLLLISGAAVFAVCMSKTPANNTTSVSAPIASTGSLKAVGDCQGGTIPASWANATELAQYMPSAAGVVYSLNTVRANGDDFITIQLKDAYTGASAGVLVGSSTTVTNLNTVVPACGVSFYVSQDDVTWSAVDSNDYKTATINFRYFISNGGSPDLEKIAYSETFSASIAVKVSNTITQSVTSTEANINVPFTVTSVAWDQTAKTYTFAFSFTPVTGYTATSVGYAFYDNNAAAITGGAGSATPSVITPAEPASPYNTFTLVTPAMTDCSAMGSIILTLFAKRTGDSGNYVYQAAPVTYTVTNTVSTNNCNAISFGSVDFGPSVAVSAGPFYPGSSAEFTLSFSSAPASLTYTFVLSYVSAPESGSGTIHKYSSPPSAACLTPTQECIAWTISDPCSGTLGDNSCFYNFPSNAQAGATQSITVGFTLTISQVNGAIVRRRAGDSSKSVPVAANAVVTPGSGSSAAPAAAFAAPAGFLGASVGVAALVANAILA